MFTNLHVLLTRLRLVPISSYKAKISTYKSNKYIIIGNVNIKGETLIDMHTETKRQKIIIIHDLINFSNEKGNFFNNQRKVLLSHFNKQSQNFKIIFE